jgi:hypothetical protein
MGVLARISDPTIPIPDPLRRRQRVILRGDVPSPVNPPKGCRFHPRRQLRQEFGAPAIWAEQETRRIDITARRDADGMSTPHLCACHFRGPGARELPHPG